MKKVIVVLIVIAAAIAIFAVVAGKDDIAKSAEKVEAPVEQQIKQEELKKNIKSMKAIKMPKLNLDKTKFRKSIRKSREENPDFNQKQKKCGE